MKFLQRSFCLLLCFALSLGVSSLVASAEEAPLDNYSLRGWAEFYYSNGDVDSTSYYNFVPNSGTQQKTTLSIDYLDTFGSTSTLAGTHTHVYHLLVSPTDGKPLMTSSNGSAKFVFSDIYYSVGIQASSFNYYRNPTSIRALVTYSDGGNEYFDVRDFDISGTKLSLQFEFVPTLNVTSIEFLISQDITLTFKGSATPTILSYVGEWDSDGSHSIIIDLPTKSEGLLSGILDKAKDIVNGLKDGFKDTVNNLKEGFNNVVDSLKNLPERIWEKISDGLKSLFVPSDEYVEQWFSDSQAMFTRQLGGIFEVITILTSYWQEVDMADLQDSIEFPEVAIDFADGSQFAFGGFTVRVVPEGFEFLADACKVISGIICTVLFIGGLRKRYDEVMGVSSK